MLRKSSILNIQQNSPEFLKVTVSRSCDRAKFMDGAVYIFNQHPILLHLQN